MHYADFHILCANTFKWSPTVLRVGVAQAGHDATGMWATSDLPLGWGWTYLGVVWHDGLDWGEPLGEAYTWGAGDVLRLWLDMDAGVLAGGKNGGPLTRAVSCHQLGRRTSSQLLRVSVLSSSESSEEEFFCVFLSLHGLPLNLASATTRAGVDLTWSP